MSELYDQEFQPVTVDHGDLMEVLQAANAWAAYLRDQADAIRAQNATSLASAKRERYTDAANRIDIAASNLRSQSIKPC